ncbi:hypothetical protein AVEN_183138-1 [Araneus ventricosus]|uniref:Uncharacterized protein n=1 Tax=Araneus ventricosus TaxID=182803 RepID=A0A4Y2QEU3_ARAVE|nr:hypothetical protein AVEN_183138-1 [Araneus ventricosus]
MKVHKCSTRTVDVVTVENCRPSSPIVSSSTVYLIFRTPPSVGTLRALFIPRSRYDGDRCGLMFYEKNSINLFQSVQKLNRTSRAPEFGPLDFFMFDLVKDCMYLLPYANMQELKHRITAASHSISTQMLANTGVKSSIAWTCNTQTRDLTTIFINFCSFHGIENARIMKEYL